MYTKGATNTTDNNGNAEIITRNNNVKHTNKDSNTNGSKTKPMITATHVTTTT